MMLLVISRQLESLGKKVLDLSMNYSNHFISSHYISRHPYWLIFTHHEQCCFQFHTKDFNVFSPVGYTGHFMRGTVHTNIDR